MPVLEAADTMSPRSALHYRPLTSASQARSKGATTEAHPVIQRASRPRPRPADDTTANDGDMENIAIWKVADKRASKPPKQQARRLPTRQATGWRAHPWLVLILGMLAMFLGWNALNAGISWWTDAMNSLHYGYPRTYQLDAVVGHEDSSLNPSHFLATNLHGRIEIIEFPGGDGSHARIYLGPQLFGPDADKTPVTLLLADVNGDHRPDMLVFFQSSWIVLINDQGSFRTATPQERQDAMNYLVSHGQ